MKKLCPNDPDAAKKLKECEKAVKKIKFEEAIALPESERHSVADSIDYRAIGTITFLLIPYFLVSTIDSNDLCILNFCLP